MERTCKSCGAEIAPTADRRKIYCDTVCKSAFWRTSSPGCSVDGCHRRQQARSLCATHYQQKRATGAYGVLCAELDCSRGSFARGFCNKHYSQRCRSGEFGEDLVRRDLDRTINRRYGLAPGTYGEMMAAQDSRCAICRRECPSGHRLAVDHDHATGAVRGLLCVSCNRGIGYLGDSAETLAAAVAYLNVYA